jgi:hypothetical protein
MTTIQITLPDQLAKEARQAGLLTPQLQRLREQLQAQRVDQLFSAINRMGAVNGPAIMSPEEVAEEIAGMRAERRANKSQLMRLVLDTNVVVSALLWDGALGISVVRGCGRAKLSEKKNALCERKERLAPRPALHAGMRVAKSFVLSKVLKFDG